MQFILGMSAFATCLCVLVFFPETSHPGSLAKEKQSGSGWRRGFVFTTLKTLWIWRYPNPLLVIVIGTAVLITDYLMFVPIASTLGIRYNIKNEALIGACLLPSTLGNISQ